MNKYNYNSTANDYKTPPEIYNIALEHLGLKQFALDACCSEKNIPAEIHYFNGIHDGLSEDWYDNTWVNPPFNEAEKWVKKAFFANQLCKINIAMLLPARTETAYWRDYILKNQHCQIQFLRKGYKFLNRDNVECGIFKNSLALVYFTPEPQNIRLIA